MAGFGLRVYSTCPQSKDVAAAEYADRVADVARWSEDAGCHGILVYTDNGIADPWLVAQRVIEATTELRPLVAVQPVYMHPYSVAKMVASLAYLHGRAVDLNMLAGGFRNDLLALGDETPHDDRYKRTVEYTLIVTGLLNGETVTVDGEWHRVKNLRLTPELPAELRPGLTISGSSPAGLAAAEEKEEDRRAPHRCPLSPARSRECPRAPVPPARPAPARRARSGGAAGSAPRRSAA